MSKYKPTCVKCNTSLLSTLKVKLQKLFCIHHYEPQPLKPHHPIVIDDSGPFETYRALGISRCHKCFKKKPQAIQLYDVVVKGRKVTSYSFTPGESDL